LATRDSTFSLLEVIQIELDEAVPFSGEVFLREDRLDGAFVDAEAAVDAGVGIDVELIGLAEVGLILGGMDAVDGAHLDAGGVLGSDAGLADDVRHWVRPWVSFAGGAEKGTDPDRSAHAVDEGADYTTMRERLQRRGARGPPGRDSGIVE